MHAAVVTAFGSAPVWQSFSEPEPEGAEVVVDVLAVGIHPRVRSQADGSHYASEGSLPLIPGVDGVGRFPDGTTRYFVVASDTRGSMAERVAVDPRASVVIPDGADPVAVAAAANPVMSSWVALRHRIAWTPRARVLVLGATGAAGSAAIQVAKHLGASHVIASGRNAVQLVELPSLGADEIVPVQDADAIGRAAADVDVVLDYVWGSPAADAMRAIVTARAARGTRLDWITIGSSAGQDAAIPSAALRSSGLTIVGSGQGSVGRAAFVAELPEIVRVIADGTITTASRAVPASQVETAWDATGGARRLVVTL
ncbi:MAG: zinc-binding alcohol dehydrogenase family protein [Candidatus Microbacterium colombiense]|nr:MAG: zinc-binding alcohol dehydrogenase family protein [Microbacterium sp.]